MNATLELKNVSHEYGGLTVLENISLAVNQGEFVSIIGPSGCGKTTLLKIIAGLLTPTQGQVQVGGMSAGEARTNRLCGLVFQQPVLLPWRTVEQNIALPTEVTGVGSITHARELAHTVGLGGFEHHYPHQLSGGMQQRAALARALLLNPQVLLLDEPFGALDEIARTQMGLELLRLRDTSLTALFVTHSVEEAVLLSDRVVVLSGRPAQVADTVVVPLPRPRTLATKDSPIYLEVTQRLRTLIYS